MPPRVGSSDALWLPAARPQAVRLLALLSTDASSEPALRSAPWLPFLRDAAASDDCTLASDAGRALLNMRSAAAAAAATSAPTPAAKCAVPMPLLVIKPSNDEPRLGMQYRWCYRYG
jgi:hypothetical protein